MLWDGIAVAAVAIALAVAVAGMATNRDKLFFGGMGVAAAIVLVGMLAFGVLLIVSPPSDQIKAGRCYAASAVWNGKTYSTHLVEIDCR